ncbi:hypothetical protein QTV49_001761 [Vibrio vulnificus]|nr:hypothetical protein [Vibrio vulnificus]
MYSVFIRETKEEKNKDKTLKTTEQRIEDECNQYYDPPPLDEEYNKKYPRYRGTGLTRPKQSKSDLRLKAKRRRIARRKNRF